MWSRENLLSSNCWATPKTTQEAKLSLRKLLLVCLCRGFRFPSKLHSKLLFVVEDPVAKRKTLIPAIIYPSPP